MTRLFAKPNLLGQLRSVGRLFGARDEGATAVEFALVGMPFIVLIGALFEAGMLLLSQQTLDNALDQAARTVFTGTFQAGYEEATPPADRMRKAICSEVTTFSCGSVLIDVSKASTFADLALTSPYNSTTKSVADGFGTKFQCPSGSDVVGVRAAVVVPRFFGFFDPNNLAIGKTERLLVSTIIFRAEPYGSGKC